MSLLPMSKKTLNMTRYTTSSVSLSLELEHNLLIPWCVNIVPSRQKVRVKITQIIIIIRFENIYSRRLKPARFTSRISIIAVLDNKIIRL